MGKKCKFSYNKIDDTLAVSCREENENVRETFMFDKFIFSLTGKGKIVGIQILNASKVFEESNSNPNLLEYIDGISMVVIKKNNCLLIGLAVMAKNQTANIPIRVLMPNMTMGD